MKFRHLVSGFVAGCTVTVLAVALTPQDDVDMDAMWAEAAMKYGAPAEEHAVLANRAGNWNCAIKYWYAPGTPAQETVGRASFAMIMDGRWLFQEFESNFEGQTFTGSGVTGFDRMKGKYVSAWIDNMSTSLMTSWGTRDGKNFEFHGKAPDMMKGEFVDMKSIEKMVDDDTFILEMHMPGPDGKMFKHMEITYTREV